MKSENQKRRRRRVGRKMEREKKEKMKFQKWRVRSQLNDPRPPPNFRVTYFHRFKRKFPHVTIPKTRIQSKNAKTRLLVRLNGRSFFFRQRSEVESSGKRPAEGSKTFPIDRHYIRLLGKFIVKDLTKITYFFYI